MQAISRKVQEDAMVDELEKEIHERWGGGSDELTKSHTDGDVGRWTGDA